MPAFLPDHDLPLKPNSKANRLEIYELTAEGLVLRHTKALFGKVTMLDRLRPTSSSTDHLFVGTDRHLYFTLSWDPATKQLRTEKAFVDQSDAAGRDSQSSDRCAIDPAGNVLAMELFEGIMTILPIVADGKSKAVNGDTTGALGEPTAVRIPELFIRSWAWLHARPTAPQPKRKAAARGPRLAMLFDDSHGKVRLRVKELQHVRGADDVDLVDCDATQKDVEPSASHVVPVPAPAYGLLVLAERSVTYVDEESTAAYRHPLESPTIWAAWAPVDETRWLLGDDYGRLFFLMLRIAEDGEVQGFKIDSIGKVSRASVITYLDGGYAFIGSHSGDSQVIKIGPGSFDVVQSLSNIGPVLDFTVMDMGNRSDESQTNEYSSGQARIVTGSGAFEDGSLRSVRSGVGIEELGSLGSMPSVTQLFSLKSNWASEWDDVLVASLIDETRVFRFAAGGEIEELQSLHGLQLDESTLLAQDLLNGLILQCTSSAVRLVDIDSEMVTASWTPDAGSPIVAASANEQEVVVSIAGLELVALNLASNLTVIARQEPGAGQQVSCVDVPSVVTSICVVGFWQHAEVAILQTQTLQEVSRTTVSEDEAAVPRSVLLTQIIPDHNPNLFVALADGNVVTFDVQSSKYLLTDRKSTILGTQQANFKALPRGEGLFNVFATCEHPSLIYGSEGRIVYSAVTIENASYVCNFNAEAYPGAIAMAANEELKLALVDTERTTHVQKLHIGETVRRLAYSPKHKAFGMGTISRRLEKAAEVVQSHFKLADEVIFEQLHTYDLRVDELVECVMRADVVDTFQGKAERFVVGTAYMSEKQPELPRGRILLFEVTADRVLQLVTELDVRGACRALAVVQGKIVAALVKAVSLSSCFRCNADGQLRLSYTPSRTASSPRTRHTAHPPCPSTSA